MSDLNIYQRMMKITEDAEAIPKNGYNSFSKYKYVKAVDLMGHIKKLLIKYGVHLDVEETDLRRSLHGKNFHSEIYCKGIFTNIDNPEEQITVPFWSVSADTLDKDIFKAKTNGLKYLLSQEFKVVTDDFKDTETSGKETDDQHEEYLSDSQLANIEALIDEVKPDLEKFCKHFKIKDTFQLKADQYEIAVKMLERKRDE